MSRDTNFYYSFLVLPARKRRAIVAVWDFCRAVDDAVDEVVPEEEWRGGLTPTARDRASQGLDHWRDELEACYSGTPISSQGRTLQPFVNEFALPRQSFNDLIEGVEMDLNQARYATFDELATYCQRVASSVGLVCLEIFGYQDPGSRRYAVDLGMALQLTNIIRDVATDQRRGRIYIPTDELERFGVMPADLEAGIVTPPVRALLAFQCQRARSYYARASREQPQVDARQLVAADIMGAIYSEILRRIERSNYDVFSGRIRVPRPHRAVIALTVLMKSWLGIRHQQA